MAKYWKNKWTRSCIYGALFLLLILFVKFVDVSAIGPGKTSIGLSFLNGSFHKWIGVHAFWYYLTEVLGILALLLAGLFAVAGVMQWIKRKSIAKVDREILCLGGLFAVALLVYVFFDKVVVNFRPVLEKGQTVPEPSFPSSHTVLACLILGGIFLILPKYVKDKKAFGIMRLTLVGLIVLMVIGRTLSGVHWLTDIIGGILLSAAILTVFEAVLDLVCRSSSRSKINGR